MRGSLADIHNDGKKISSSIMIGMSRDSRVDVEDSVWTISIRFEIGRLLNRSRLQAIGPTGLENNPECGDQVQCCEQAHHEAVVLIVPGH